MSSLGIYFGPKLIGIAETRARKLVNNIQIPQSVIAFNESGLDEKVSTQAKLLEIINIFKDELRRNKIKAQDATLSISGKDLIIRTFEIPLLPREELESAINFEAKKYIPFKLEELISTFQVVYDKSRHTNLVLYLGMKKDILNRYLTIVNQLEVKINAVEYSAFSILRFLKSTGSAPIERGTIGVFSVDLSESDEVNFMVLDNGFPLFSRDIVLAEEAQKEPKEQELDPSTALEKLKTEIRLSLDYYNRKFSYKSLKKVFFLCNQGYRSNLESFMMDMGLNPTFVEISKNIDASIPYSLNLIKGYGASLSQAIGINLKLDLLSAKEKDKEKRLKEKAVKVEMSALLKGLSLDYRIILLGILICLATFGWGLYRAQPVRNQHKQVIDARIETPIASPTASLEDLKNLESEYNRKLNNLTNLVENQLYVTDILNSIARSIPKGVWLTNFSFNKAEGKEAGLSLEGMVYLADDADKEIETSNKFLTNLKQDPDFKKYFKEIRIISLDRVQVEKMPVTRFSINCKT